MLVAYRMNY